MLVLMRCYGLFKQRVYEGGVNRAGRTKFVPADDSKSYAGANEPAVVPMGCEMRVYFKATSLSG
jgi:hypothetical protein